MGTSLCVALWVSNPCSSLYGVLSCGLMYSRKNSPVPYRELGDSLPVLGPASGVVTGETNLTPRRVGGDRERTGVVIDRVRSGQTKTRASSRFWVNWLGGCKLLTGGLFWEERLSITSFCSIACCQLGNLSDAVAGHTVRAA